MRLLLVFRDKEYQNALVERISNIDKDIYVDIGDASLGENYKSSIILTDISPDSIDEKTLKQIQDKTVFLVDHETDNYGTFEKGKEKIEISKNVTDESEKTFTIHKYKKASEILRGIISIYNKINNLKYHKSINGKKFAIYSSCEDMSSLTSSMLSRQLIATTGKSVAIIPLSFINPFPDSVTDESRILSKFIYKMDTGQKIINEEFFIKDSYGISYLKMTKGVNELAYIKGDILAKLINYISENFNSVVIDIGTCFRKENIDIIKTSDRVISVNDGQIELDLNNILHNTDNSKFDNKLIDLTFASDLSLQLSDYIKNLSGEEKIDNKKSCAR